MLFYSFLRYHACSLLLSMPRVVCHAGAMQQDGSGGPRQKEQRHAQHHTPPLQERGIWWRSVGVHSRSYPEESGKGLSYREVGRAKKGESPTLAGDRSTSPMPTTLFSTPLFCPLSSMELADVCILVIAGYVRGETGIVGTLLRDRRIEMLSVERAHET